ncbi:hypothetical protein BH11MYX1_BH11MYX1_53680 [soil metagenome]
MKLLWVSWVSWIAVLAACGGKADLPIPTQADKTALIDAACPIVTGPYFFEVTKAGRTSHILGTRHLSIPLSKFPEVVGATLDHASLLVEEIAPDDHPKPTFNDEPLRDELGPKAWAHYEQLVGPQIAVRVEHKASIVAILMLSAMYEDFTVALDKQIAERTAAKQIPSSGLELSGFQIELLMKLLDLRLLKAYVEETPDRAKLRQTSHDGIEHYCKGDEKGESALDGVEENKLISHGYTKADLDNFKEVLLYKRNLDWMPKLEQLLEQDHVFVAVGAGHLQGPRGVIEMLKSRGYTITRITK